MKNILCICSFIGALLTSVSQSCALASTAGSAADPNVLFVAKMNSSGQPKLIFAFAGGWFYPVLKENISAAKAFEFVTLEAVDSVHYQIVLSKSKNECFDLGSRTKLGDYLGINGRAGFGISYPCSPSRDNPNQLFRKIPTENGFRLKNDKKGIFLATSAWEESSLLPPFGYVSGPINFDFSWAFKDSPNEADIFFTQQ